MQVVKGAVGMRSADASLGGKECGQGRAGLVT